MKLANYVQGKWIEGDGDGVALFNAVNGQQIAEATTKGLDFNGILNYARTVGGQPRAGAHLLLELAAPAAQAAGPVDEEEL